VEYLRVTLSVVRMQSVRTRRSVIELTSLRGPRNSSIPYETSRTPKLQDYYYSEFEVPENNRSPHSGYMTTMFIVSYALLFVAFTTSVVTVVAFVLARQHSVGSMLSAQSVPFLKDQCQSKSLQIYNLLTHLLVNCVGTLLLGLSNYFQQICASPTVDDVADGFRKSGDVSFGANSPSAVFKLGRKLSALWAVLVLTSLPIHIMLNGITGFALKSVQAERHALADSDLGNLTATELSWSHVSSDQCAQLLVSARAHVTNFRNVTVIIRNGLSDEATSYYEGLGESYYAKSSDIVECFVNEILSECQLTLRWFPLLCTALAIVAKAVIMAIAIRRHPHFQKRSFNTLGDMITLGASHPELRELLPDFTPPKGALFPGIYRRCSRPWRHALGRFDVLVEAFWWISAATVAAIGFYTWNDVAGGTSVSELINRFGLGTLDPATSLVSGLSGIPYQVGLPFPMQTVIANLPQLWLTVGYLTWNNQIGRIWMEREWRSFYRNPRLPRVSYDTKATGVRSARWLQLPYWLTGVLMLVSTLMHWLVSQTLFVVEVYFENPTVMSVFHLHYSPLAIISVGLIGLTLVLGITIYYFLPVRSWMPLMAGSARVVFDSCTRLPRSALPRTGIEWGDISTRYERMAGFAENVARMVEGVYYPGLISEESTYDIYSPSFDRYSHYTGFVASFDTEPLVKRY
jgi:hypothetical protein